MTRTLDVAGTVITVPDPEEIAKLSGRFRAMGDALADAHEELSAQASARSWSQWTGPSATAFGQTIGQLPGQLGAAQESYHEAAAALSDYANQARPVVATLTSLATQADDAAANLTATQRARDQATPLTSSMTTVPHPDLAGLDLRVTLARAAVEQVQSQVRVQQSELKTLATRCVTRIHQALPDQGRHPGFLGELGQLGRGTLGVAGDLTVRPFTDTFKDLKKAGHDLDFAKIGKVLGDVSGVLGVLALIPGLDGVAIPLLLGVSALAVAADGIGLLAGERDASWSQLGWDASGLVLGSAGRLFEEAGAAKGLADGEAAQASAADLLKAGAKHVVNWSDINASLADDKESVGQAVNWAGSVRTEGMTPANLKQLQTALTNVRGSFADHATEFLHLGADGSAPTSAATVFQHVGFFTDRTDDLVDVVHGELDDHSHSSSSGSPQ